jgi:cytochrome c oxidase assembly protein subunit 15
MTLSEFKSIYWMEWAHRMWGRCLGLAFVLPGCYFLFVKKTVTPRLGKRLALLLAAGGGQGMVGWWMVRSGLKEPTEQSGLKEPRVAPTRLAAHLASATAIYCTLVYTSLQLAFPVPPAAFYAKRADTVAALRKVRMVAHPLAGIIAVTALSGAFVAGLDAGRAYNTFPKMNGEWIPEEYPGLQGAFSDTVAAQLHHRVLAGTTFLSTWAAWAAARNPSGSLPRTAALALAALPVAATLQASLGIATLLTYVPPGLGSAHQAGALGLLTLALGLIFVTRRPPRVLASATKRVMSGSSSGGGVGEVAKAPAAA